MSLAAHCTMVADMVADQLHFFIVFYKTCPLPERRLSLFVGAYIEPRPSDEFPLTADFLLFGRPMEWAL